VRNFFWVADDLVDSPFGTAPLAPMYVEWSAPAEPTRPVPVVLVHGGGGQGTDWLGTPDGRPGWAGLLLDAGWTVYVVDRPGHGRSPRLPALEGPPPPAPTREMIAGIFAPGTDERHTQWPGRGGSDDPAITQLTASAAPFPPDLAAAQELEAARLAALLDRIGPAVVVTHSLGAPACWLAADRRPGQVVAMIAVEPAGPPFLSLPNLGISLDWGLTSAALTYHPPVAQPAELDLETPRALPHLSGFPIAVLETEASPMGAGAGAVVAFLRNAGADAHHLRLVDLGIHGNGHGVIFERNNDLVLDAVLGWLASALSAAPDTRAGHSQGQSAPDRPPLDRY
jgi:pimeloyl-ACP methyl ester carboxylesterase